MSFKLSVVILFLCSSFLTQCQNKNILVGVKTPEIPYDFSDHDGKFDVDKDLDEISGIALLSKNLMLAVADEEPDIFVYDLDEENEIRVIDFGKDADYEGLCVVDDLVSVLDSRGRLFQFTIDKEEDDDEKLDKDDVSKINIKGFTAGEIEGICYDAQNKYYLLAFKGRTNKDAGHERSIYIYENAYTDIEHFLTIGNEELKAYFRKYKVENEDIIEMAENLVLLKPSFYPSAIEIHPKSKDIYLLSAVRELLMIVDSKTKAIKAIVKLDNDKLPQPEGITFDIDGTLYISSEEADGEDAVILMYKMKN